MNSSINNKNLTDISIVCNLASYRYSVAIVHNNKVSFGKIGKRMSFNYQVERVGDNLAKPTQQITGSRLLGHFAKTLTS
jgi:hypothetical protein